MTDKRKDLFPHVAVLVAGPISLGVGMAATVATFWGLVKAAIRLVVWWRWRIPKKNARKRRAADEAKRRQGAS